MSAEDEGYNGPEFEVWNHLWSGVDMAANELRVLDPEHRRSLETLAKTMIDARSQAIVFPDTLEARLLSADDLLVKHKWLRHALEIEIASIAIYRSETALKRYFRLRPAVMERGLPARASRYMAEVISTFAFGFDAACIALCRATLEQLLRDELVTRQIYTQPQLRRERPTAGALVANAKRANIITASAAAAERIVTKGDTIMHQFMYEDKVIEQQAIDSIKDLLEVIGEVLKPAE